MRPGAEKNNQGSLDAALNIGQLRGGNAFTPLVLALEEDNWTY